MKWCVHHKDFEPGRPFVEEMARCINNSQKVLVLFSKLFLKSKFGDYEMKLAIHRMAQKRDDCLVIIKIDDVDRNNLPPELISNSFIDCTSPLERPFWEAKVLKLFRPRSTSEWISGNNNEITVKPAFLRNSSIETCRYQQCNVNISDRCCWKHKRLKVTKCRSAFLNVPCDLVRARFAYVP